MEQNNDPKKEVNNVIEQRGIDSKTPTNIDENELPPDITDITKIIDMYNLDPENDEGNVEYKYQLTDFTPAKLEKRTTQMKYRIDEGSGEAFYCIGVMDDGTPLGLNEEKYIESINNLNLIALNLGYNVTKLSESVKDKNYMGEFLIREKDDNKYIDLKIGVAGNVDAGKSTTVGTLTRGILDDGRGKSRVFAFNFKHEVETGRTSSIGHQIMGFDKNNDVINSKSDRQMTWTDIVSQSTKIVTFLDLAGHEKYLRTTIHGLTSLFPDYCLIMVGANMGVNHMTREHIALCLSLSIPFIIVVTKIDIVPINVLEENITKIHTLCKIGAKKIPFTINSSTDVYTVAKNIKKDNIVPIIQISNVKNINLDLLKMLLNLLPIRNDFTENIEKPVELLIDNTYKVEGHPTIVSGLLKNGKIKVGDSLALGPFNDGEYKQVKVKSIHCKFVSIKEAKAGVYICLSLKNIERDEIHKGMVVVADIEECKISRREFWANVNIIHSPTTIKVGYQPYIHVEQIGQSAKIIEIVKLSSAKPLTTDKEKDTIVNDEKEGEIVLRTGDKARIKLRFTQKPEYVKPQMKLIFREGKVKAFGSIIDIN